jgi:uncharacterized protein YkvS
MRKTYLNIRLFCNELNVKCRTKKEEENVLRTLKTGAFTQKGFFQENSTNYPRKGVQKLSVQKIIDFANALESLISELNEDTLLKILNGKEEWRKNELDTQTFPLGAAINIYPEELGRDGLKTVCIDMYGADMSSGPIYSINIQELCLLSFSKAA